MPDLHQTLRSTDLDFLQRIAHTWKIDLVSQGFTDALKEIETNLKEKNLFQETLELLPEPAAEAWNYLRAHHGRESWAIFTRQFGELRAFGVARRGRENPDQNPISAVEILWYRGLIGRAFLNLTKEPQEYAYIPDEFLNMIDDSQPQLKVPLPRPASEAENKIQTPARDSILDDATVLLAALRMNRPFEKTHLPQRPAYIHFLLAVLSQANLITAERLPEPEKVKDFLSTPRADSLLLLFQVWQKSKNINDLKMLPGLICDGDWNNDPQIPRDLVIEIISQLDPATWWSIPSVLSQLKSQMPDFQRPAGDYDSWFILDEKTHNHLRGFESWDKVDGALIRYLIGGPLFWLGIVDIARAGKSSPPLSFRISEIGRSLLKGQPPILANNESGLITITSEGTLFADEQVPRPIRYQLSRFCEPILTGKSENKYRITAESLLQAGEQGLRPTQLTQLLQQSRVKNLPQSIVEALDRWEKYGAEVSVEPALLLHLDKPELMPILQKTPGTSRCLGEILNPKVVVVKPGRLEPLKQALAEIGLLAQVKLDKAV
jgi:hypothetical protein